MRYFKQLFKLLWLTYLSNEEDVIKVKLAFDAIQLAQLNIALLEILLIRTFVDKFNQIEAKDISWAILEVPYVINTLTWFLSCHHLFFVKVKKIPYVYI